MNKIFGYFWLGMGIFMIVISTIAWSMGADHSNWFHESGDHLLEIMLGMVFMRLSKYEKN